MWDPVKYLDYAGLRARPFHDLIGRIPVVKPRRVADLGCGPGNLTAVLAERWPDAVIEASDSSPEMVEAARSRGVDARVLDVNDWTPEPDTDVVISNAVLQWVPEHRVLLRRWVGHLPSGATLAFQVPGNFDAPSHALVRALARTEEWASRLADVVLRENEAVDSPLGYGNLLADAGCAVDAWETTYLQRLTGEDAVLEWITGTSLRPVKEALPGADWDHFRAQIARKLDEAYPPRSDGSTWFEFRRVFVVAVVP
ncbi:trans-aconitate 2-methyltransferase [Amycolatopsis sp. cmx-11-32]|uniref:trans-aconitate 2-methyltransferase n=1 Tax=Amycolatopsis sp. cmx-11-32 TaxID=2785796 RepID=UPI0039E40371